MDIFKDYMNSFFGILVILIGLIAIPEIRQKRRYWITAILICCVMFYIGIDKINRDDAKDVANQKRSDRDSVRITAIQSTLNNDTARFSNFIRELKSYNIKDSLGHPTYINNRNTYNTHINAASNVKIGGD